MIKYFVSKRKSKFLHNYSVCSLFTVNVLYNRPELIPVYRQSTRRWLSHGRLALISAMPAVTSVAFTRWRLCHPYTAAVAHPIPACYSFIDPKRMKSWVGLVGWPVVDVLHTIVVPISCRSSVGQGKFVGQRPTFYTGDLNLQDWNLQDWKMPDHIAGLECDWLQYYERTQ